MPPSPNVLFVGQSEHIASIFEENCKSSPDRSTVYMEPTARAARPYIDYDFDIDLVVLDIELAEDSSSAPQLQTGLSLIDEILAKLPDASVIVFSDDDLIYPTDMTDSHTKYRLDAYSSSEFTECQYAIDRVTDSLLSWNQTADQDRWIKAASQAEVPEDATPLMLAIDAAWLSADDIWRSNEQPPPDITDERIGSYVRKALTEAGFPQD